MGRTNPTYRDQLRRLEAEWDDYRRALRRRDQLHFERLFVHAREHADAAGMLNHPQPIVSALLSICLEQERRIDELEAELEQVERVE